MPKRQIAIAESLTKIRVSALKEVRTKFEYSRVWTADGKIMYKDEDDIKFKVYFDLYSDQQLCYRETGIVFYFDSIILFLFVCGIFYKEFQNNKLLCLFNTFYRHTTFN